MLMAAAVYDPDPDFCLWFVEPAVYAFGRRRVMTTLLDYLQTVTDAELRGTVTLLGRRGLASLENP